MSFVMLSGEEDLKFLFTRRVMRSGARLKITLRDPMVTLAGLVPDIAKVAYPNG